jgi:cobalt-zinc-cadmium efflux system membrane fusion protein
MNTGNGRKIYLPCKHSSPIFTMLQVISLLVAIGLTGCKEKQKSPNEPNTKVEGDKITFPTNAPQLGYLTIEPAQERKAAAIGLYGRLAWDDDVTVRVYSPVAGRIIAVPVEVNQHVAAGDALATLDSPDFGQALANARTAVGNLAAADKALSRTKELFAHGAAAQKDIEAAKAADVAAEAERDRAEATLANYGGSDTSSNEIYSLRSPLAGVLVEKNISPGQEIRPDLMLANAQQFINPQFVVTDQKRLWLFLDVDELTVTSLTSGQEVFVHTQAYPDRIFHGRLEVIGDELDPTTRTIKVRCLVDNGDNLLRAEMYVTVDVTANTAAGLEISSKAIFLKDNQPYVFVEIGPGQFQRRAVKLGVESNGHTAVLDGIAMGDRVVSDGCLLLESILEGDNS